MKRKVALFILLCYFVACVAPFAGRNYINTDEEESSSINIIQNFNDNKILSIEEIEKIEKNLVEIENLIKPEIIIEYFTGWLTDTSNIRKAPSLDAEVVVVLPFAKEIQFSIYNEEWNYIKYEEETYYIWKELVSETPIECKYYDVPYNKLKSFMSYKSITAKSSEQYKLQQIAYSGDYGIRQVNGRFCIAVGSAYTTKVGTYIDLILMNGVVIPCILADCKADQDTDDSNILTLHDKSLAEFVVDTNKINSILYATGDVSDCCEEWKSTIVAIKIYDIKEIY